MPAGAAGPSSNWLALQKTLPKTKTRPRESRDSSDLPRKRRKIEQEELPSHSTLKTTKTSATRNQDNHGELEEMRNGESLTTLRKMVAGNVEYTEAQTQPGKYLALDCEMVGVGSEGEESSLARVSIVNFYGAIQLDAFVRQRERVVDYRTQWSGVRESDMVNARPFDEIQGRVAALLKDRILVGHALQNDTKALLLSHPRPYTRDTQHLAGKHKVAKSKYVALRNLVKQELGIGIQEGEHSSVTDARATMAVFRIHRKEWEKGFPSLPASGTTQPDTGARERDDDNPESDSSDDDDQAPEPVQKKQPRPRRHAPTKAKGISSGLTTIVHKRGVGKRNQRTAIRSGENLPKAQSQWWNVLGNGSAKGSMSLRM
ncbi:unnamed protein product [Mycena citricolor]|uniref:RNA exonuclease 4 n=1 Tax=Mycena citricolor TaxID=2018698 RepID=A0AAD2GX70_9AGAR|nr:unnamed protein product [Mycena citricolor]